MPQFSYVIPDECHDMHGAPPVCVDSGNPGDVDDNWLVSTADAFVAQTVHEITHSRIWREGNNAIVINFDEGDDNAGCCGTNPGGGRALAVVVTNHGPRGLEDATPYNHYSLLATLEGIAGVPCLAGACDAPNIKAMTPLFAVTPGTRADPVPDRLLGARRLLDRNGPVGPQPPIRRGTDSPVATPPPGAGAPGSWKVLPSPNLSSNDNNLAAVSAGSARDAWAVGNYYTDQNPNVFRNLAVHWDGTRWTALAPPNVGDQENTLFGVSTLPSGRAWAVGYYADQTFRIRTLAEYWDGSAWQVIPTPDPGRARDVLFSVKAVSDDDAWAVGYTEDTADGSFRTLIERWNGVRWSVTPSPDPAPNGNELFAVAASRRDRVWAVGQQLGTGFPSLALAERWNGHRWQVAPAPVSGSESYDPFAATSLGRRLLAVGDQEDDAVPQTTLSFSGRRVLPSADLGTGENDFYAVASGVDGPWAAGRVIDRSTDLTSPLIERLVNARWESVPAPRPAGAGGGAGLGGVTIAPDGEAWAVGAFNTSTSANRTLIERFTPPAGG